MFNNFSRLISTMLIVTCSQIGLANEVQQQARSTSNGQQIDPSEIPPKLLKERRRSFKYEVHYKLEEEVWDDPAVQSEPRAQFMWSGPETDKYGEDNKLGGIWSMRLDGTDLRRVVGFDVLYTPIKGSFNGGVSFKRSLGGGRYLAYAILTDTPQGGYQHERRVIDLETKEVMVIPSEAFGKPEFEWLNDHILLFVDVGVSMMQFDVKTRKITPLSENKVFKGLKIIDYYSHSGGKQLLLRAKNFKTGKINGYIHEYPSLKLVEVLPDIGTMAKNGKHWFRKPSADAPSWAKSSAYSFDKPNAAEAHYPRRFYTDFISFSALDFVITESGGVLRMLPKEGKDVVFDVPGPGSVRNLSIYNYD